LVAVTGTNGKTSCTHWLAQGWGVDDDVAAVIGTLGSGRLSELQTFGLTTPDVVSLHRMLAGFRKQGVRSVAIEASSIGLHQGRLDGARIAAAVFTNLSHDHLDYHGSLQAYGQAKALLFARPDLRAAVVNLDDPASGQMLRALESGPSAAAQRVGYSIGEEAAVKPARLDARLFLSSLEARTDGMELALAGDFGKARVRLPLIGRFNASNAIAVAATWLALGMPLSQVVRRLESLSAVRGRLQRVSTGVQADREPLVLVDYAHTPDALTQVLGALRGQTQARAGRLWCVFGAGGDRDRAKRPLMAQAVAAHADRIVVTSDNPRSEQPEAIISQILAGLPRPADAVEPDRARAIAWAIDQADPADVILLAGKGHETWQEMANARLPFDDAAQALQALQHRREVAHD
jgi:UDP-N-acetylmuramyl-tripeptide synthetase